MRKLAHFLPAPLVACLLLAAPAEAGRLPRTLGYTLYVDGVRVGHSGMTVTREETVLRFESRTRVELGPNVIELTSTTEADPATYAIRRFSFEGTKGGSPVAAEVVIEGDSATGWIQTVGSPERRPRSQKNPGGFMIFEDWVMDLEVLLALRQTVATTPTSTYRLIFANSFSLGDLMTGYTGEAAVESATRTFTARKLELLLSGGHPFVSHVDPATGIPVYIHFPGTRAEAFRDDFFGDNPVSRYPATRPDPSSR